MATRVSRVLLATVLACGANAGMSALEIGPSVAPAEPPSPARAGTVVATPDLLCGTPPPPPPPPPPAPDPSPDPDPAPDPGPDEDPEGDPETDSESEASPFGSIPTPSAPRFGTAEGLRGDFGSVARVGQATVGEEHEYFERLKAMDGALCAYSLRSQNQINQFSCAGSSCVNNVVTYAPTIDDYHTPQDAARFEFRGADHPDRDGVAESDLKNQVRVPTPLPSHDDGRTYVLTWDLWLGPEFQTENLVNPSKGRQEVGSYKAFHVWANHDRSDGTKREKFWRVGMEVGKNHIALPDAASLWHQVTRAEVGPDVEDVEPLQPSDSFVVKASTWTRIWLVITQNPGPLDDKVSVWVADENHPPVKTIDNLTIEIPYDPIETQRGITAFTVQFDSSSRRRLGGGSIFGYVRNIALLQHDGSISELLERPR